MSSARDEPPISPVTATRPSPACGTSRPTTCAPSRARTLAIASPIPREAPVTSATLPWSGIPTRRRRPPRPLRRPARPDRTRTQSAARAGSGAWIPGFPRRRARRRRAVRDDPRLTSLPTERVNPSRARWAVASRGFEHASGGVPSTITRPDFSTRRIVGWKNSRSAPRPGESVIPVASKTRALNRASAGASEFQTEASRPASPAASRTSSRSSVRTAAPTEARTPVTWPTTREPAAAPSKTSPAITGWPGE